MKRREFITLLCGAATTWPLASRAQQPDRMRRIGVLMGFAENDSRGQAHMAAFRHGLQKLGWMEGSNIRITLAGRRSMRSRGNDSRRSSSRCSPL